MSRLTDELEHDIERQKEHIDEITDELEQAKDTLRGMNNTLSILQRGGAR